MTDSAARNSVVRLNAMPRAELAEHLRACCGSRRWVEGMIARRPWMTPAAVLAASDDVCRILSREDWLEAFAHHPRIGERAAAESSSPGTSAWSSREQAGVEGATQETRRRLDEANRRYEDRFGHVFLICATGKSAGEMLAALEARIVNDPETELRTAAEQQALITRLRLEKLVNP